jgi:hypothetical protein
MTSNGDVYPCALTCFPAAQQLRQTAPWLCHCSPARTLHVPIVPMSVKAPVAASMLYVQTAWCRLQDCDGGFDSDLILRADVSVLYRGLGGSCRL